ncbi:MAG: hypothetical protein LBJ87_03770 [bacterium]|jgi:hypothetical protein|nr:hypothetical protein [bacterium]
MGDRERRSRHRPFALVQAVAWRQRWRVEEAVRLLLFAHRVGFVPRRLPPMAVTAAVDAGVPRSGMATPPTGARSARVGVVGGLETVVAVCARHAGLEVCGGEVSALSSVAARASREKWPVVGLSGRTLDETPGGSLRAYLATGGTLLVTGLEPEHSAALGRLGDQIGVALPSCRPLSGRCAGLRFTSEEPALTRELAGAWFGSEEAAAFLATPAPTALAWAEQNGGRRPVVWTVPAGGGRIVLSTGASELDERGEARWRSPLALLVPLMVLRAAYGTAAWHAPFALANVTIDDPTLDRGPLGLDYGRIVRLAHEHDFHITVATVPRELRLADPEVLELLGRERRRVSACYHGNDHDGYEFYLEKATRHRFPSRSLEVQRRKLSEAAVRGSRFAEETGYALDRVMVFPHGLCAASLLPALHDRGFLATCNAVDRYPLGCARPTPEDAGTRPADLDWSGFPLLGRRGLAARGLLALDLFLGKPAVAFTHKPAIGPRLTPLLEHASKVNGLAGGGLSWCGLEDVARHAYLIRRAPDASRWDVLMTANEVCLHNPDPTERLYHVSRPRLPAGDHLRAGSVSSGRVSHPAEVDVIVPPGQTAEVRVVRSANSPELHRPRAAGGCTLLGG